MFSFRTILTSPIRQMAERVSSKDRNARGKEADKEEDVNFMNTNNVDNNISPMKTQMIIGKLSAYNSLTNEESKTQFEEQTINDRKINQTFCDLWKYHNNVFNQTEFTNYQMSGYLCKNDNSLFNNSKRYFIIDFKESYISIKKTKEMPIADKSKSLLPFRKVIRCRLLNPGEEQTLTFNKRGFEFPFVV